ncbi:MAG: hypothetical protein WCG27_04500 [Pseudomonadota bacterium]
MINNQEVKNDLVEVAKVISLTAVKAKKARQEAVDTEIKKAQQEVNKLVKVISSCDEASSIRAVAKELKENESRLDKLILQKEELEIWARNSESDSIDADHILKNIDSLRSERFRKALLTKKRELMKKMFKAIYIHPDNLIRVDLIGTNEQISEYKRTANQKGVVLPFCRTGRLLGESKLVLSRNEKNEPCWAVDRPSVIFPLKVTGSCPIASGGCYRSRTCDLYRVKGVEEQKEKF